jgi:hypothetical protein
LEVAVDELLNEKPLFIIALIESGYGNGYFSTG